MSDQIPVGAMPPEPQEAVVEPQVEDKANEQSGVDYEKSYKELQSKFGEHSNLVGSLKQENKTMMEKLANLEKQAAAREESARNEEPPTDYEKMLREVSRKYDDGDMTFEQAMLESNSITRQQAQAEMQGQMKGLLDQTTNAFQTELQNRDSNAVVQKFHEANPDFQQLQQSGDLQRIMDQEPMHDEFSAYWAHKATIARQEALDEAARVKAGSENASKVLADPGSSMQHQRKSGRPLSESEMKASMAASLR